MEFVSMNNGIRKSLCSIAVFFCIAATLAPSLHAEVVWRGLVVEPENRCSPYNKKEQYPYPQSVEDEIVYQMGGRVYGPYTGRYFVSDRETDIEHIVAASEGHDSGLCSASAEQRVEFATDLLNLTLAAPKVNRCGRGGKCGLDAAEWMPARNQCWFANRIVEIKAKYNLSVDREEALALEAVLGSCGSVEMVFYTSGDMGVALAKASDHAPVLPAKLSSDALTLYDDNNNGRITCAEARAHGIAPVTSDHPAYKFMRDGDGDGVVCE